MGVSQWLRAVVQYRVLDYLVCIILGLAGWLIGQKVRPHCRTFSWSDPHISYPHAEHPVFPTWTLALITILPGLFYVASEALLVYLSYTRQCTLHVESPYGGGASSASSARADASLVGSPSVAGDRPASAPSCGAVQTSPTTAVAIAVPRNDYGRLDTRERGRPLVPVHNLAQHPWCFFLLRAHYWVLTQAFSVTLSMLVVDSVKVYAGRLRPDFLSRLRNEGLGPDSVLTAEAWCQHARGGRLSFPSGHSAMSFAAFVPLVIYLQNGLRCFGGAPFPCCADTLSDAPGQANDHARRDGLTDVSSASPGTGSPATATPHSPFGSLASRQRGLASPAAASPPLPASSSSSLSAASSARTRDGATSCLGGLAATPYALFTLGLVPLILPITVAVSRTNDYRHHFDDILAGSFIGVCTALLAVLLNFHRRDHRGGLMPRYW